MSMTRRRNNSLSMKEQRSWFSRRSQRLGLPFLFFFIAICLARQNLILVLLTSLIGIEEDGGSNQENEKSLRVQRKQRNGGGVERLKTLSHLDRYKSQKMTWLEKGKWLLDANSLPLAAAKTLPPQTTTLVTVMIDIGRGNLDASFQRSFHEYLNRFDHFIHYDYPKIIFLHTNNNNNNHTQIIQAKLEHHAKQKTGSPYHIIPINATYIQTNFPHWNAVQKIRINQSWYSQTGWLQKSPQASLPLYNPLVMSKLTFLKQAATLNPFDTDAFLFIDGGHLCHNPKAFGSFSGRKALQQTFLSKGFLMTAFEYHADREVHGFDAEAFYRYIGTNQNPVLVGRGGIFGGKPEHIAVVADLFELIARETLAAGYMGTEENIFSIILYRFPQIVHFYNNKEGGNCAIFTDIANMKDFNLRGLECATDENNGKPVCYNTNNTHKRQYCTAEVDPSFLTTAAGQWSCQPNPDGHFCVAQCKPDGTVVWKHHKRSFCETSQSCPEEPPWIPTQNLPLRAWRPSQDSPPACRTAAGGMWASHPELFWNSTSRVLSERFGSAPTDTSSPLSRVSGLMLVMNMDREIRAAKATLDTFIAHGLLQGLGEFIIWINGRNTKVSREFDSYVENYNVKLLGSSENAGQTWPINALIQAASKEYIIFLEKDFRLIEPWPCVVEQISTGMTMIEKKQAVFIKYRHRYRPGNPNWAAIMFRGNEEKVFEQQPNLFCYHYHWIEEPDETWPEFIKKCGPGVDDPSQPPMYCSIAKYCGFTLNPFLVSRKFWIDELSPQFAEWKVHDPFQNLEYYMNWEPGAWNERPWIVAQGEGLFFHEDIEKWGA